jgi:hypothetical protein
MKQISPQKNPKFSCNNCQFKTDNKKDFNRHLLTRKHLGETNETNYETSENPSTYCCNFCGNDFNSRTTLWRHKKNCTNIEANIDENNDLVNVILELVKQNGDFKQLILEQNKQLIELSKEKSMNNCNNNTTITNTTNSSHFNLNFFLNETCKNAMNIDEFVSSITIKHSDLEDTARLGYAEGISRIFIRGLKELDVNQRPIHCSDAKRETLYIKDGNIWEKDDDNKTKLTSAIKKVAHKNMRQIPEWRKAHPQCQESESKSNDLYLKIISNSMSGGTDEEAEYNYNKIRKNIIREIIIQK